MPLIVLVRFPGGGWTLFATKVTPTFDPAGNFFNTDRFPVSSETDAIGHIPGGAQWNEVMWKFAHVLNTTYVAYTRGSNNFDRYLQVPCCPWGLETGLKTPQ